MSKLEGKTIIIVGATGGIGRVLARKLFEFGANVVLSSRTALKLESLATELNSPDQVLTASADASEAMEVEEMFAKAIHKFGSVDAVIMSAGTWKRVSIDTPDEEALPLFDTHMRDFAKIPFIVGRRAAQLFKQTSGGLIVNMSSHAALRPELKGNLTYAMGKAAGHQFILNLRHELEGSGVRATNIAPAIVDTPDNASWLDTDEKRAGAVKPEAIAEWIIDNFDNPDIPAVESFKSSVDID